MTTDPSNGHTELSIVIPVLNEQDNVEELHERLTAVLTGLKRSYEIIFVDDGSSDGSVKLCRNLVDSDPYVVLVELRRHFNKATALQAGFEVATGDVVITMDGDLQDDANEIPRFLDALDQGFDLVSGWKKKRQDCLSKRVQSRIFNRVTSFLTGISLRDFNCGFKVYRREVIEALDLYGELHRYIPVLAHAKGFRVGEIPVNHHPRIHGTSKYHFERLLRGALDLLTILFLSSFKRRPLHLFGFVGLAFALTGFSIDLYLSFLWFTGAAYIGNRPLLVLGTLLIIVGVQVLIFGLLAEMITAVTYRRSEVMELVCRIHRHLPRPLALGQRATESQYATEGAA
jgi:glycosyltransferase involved in cell wall biosynthesis